MNKILLNAIFVGSILMFCNALAFGQGGTGKVTPKPAPKPVVVVKPKPVIAKPKPIIVVKPKPVAVVRPKPAPKPVLVRPQTAFRASAPNIEMVKIPAGSFMMGSNDGDYDEKPVHKVIINYSFFMGKYEVTQGQWKAVMRNNPSSFKDCGDNCPVETVLWDDAQAFIRKLNSLQSDYVYRLPSEAEWEYAARAGATGDHYGDLDLIAWHPENSNNKMHEVGTKKANNFGLYDMLGNVEEWTQDSFLDSNVFGNSYRNTSLTDGSATKDGGSLHALRGGNSCRYKQDVRLTYRSYNPGGGQCTGFRVAARPR